MRALLIKDDSAVANSIELMLKSAGLNLYTTDLGEEGTGQDLRLRHHRPRSEPAGYVGFEVLRKLRASKVGSPILILSGLDNVEDKIKGLGFGADDYMTKPFHKDELVARIKALVRRSKGHAQSAIHVRHEFTCSSLKATTNRSAVPHFGSVRSSARGTRSGSAASALSARMTNRKIVRPPMGRLPHPRTLPLSTPWAL